MLKSARTGGSTIQPRLPTQGPLSSSSSPLSLSLLPFAAVLGCLEKADNEPSITQDASPRPEPEPRGFVWLDALFGVDLIAVQTPNSTVKSKRLKSLSI